MVDTTKSGQAVATESTDPFYSSTMRSLIEQLLTSISDPRELANYPVWSDPRTGRPYSLVAGESPYETAAYKGIAGLRTPTEFNEAANLYKDIAAYDPTLLGSAGKFTRETAQEYMSPYMKGVTDIAIRNAREEEARQRAEAGLAAARGGGYGSGRAAVADAMRAMALQRNIGDITATNQQRAFENAQQQFERDRAARLQYGQTNLSAEQFAQQQRLNAAGGLGALGTAAQTANLARLAALQGIGGAQRSQQQREIDAARSEYMNKRMWNLNNIQMALNAVRGYPLGSSTLTTSQAQQPSAGSQFWGNVGSGITNAYRFGTGWGP